MKSENVHADTPGAEVCHLFDNDCLSVLREDPSDRCDTQLGSVLSSHKRPEFVCIFQIFRRRSIQDIVAMKESVSPA